MQNLFDVANKSKVARCVRVLCALVFGIGMMAGFSWSDKIHLSEILLRHIGWTLLGEAAFLVLFPIVAYVGIPALCAAKFGPVTGFFIGTVLAIVTLFARAFAYMYVTRGGHPPMKPRWKKGEGQVDPFFKGLIGGSPSKGTGIWSLPIQVSISSGGGGRSGGSGGGRFGGGGSSGRY